MINANNSLKVQMGQKIAFGLGMLANQMFPAVLGVFMVILVEGLGFPTWMWAILYFLPRLMDAITDPIMGLITDNTRSKWGRRRQYVFIGALVMGFAFIFMWQLYGYNSITFNFFYFLAWSFVFYIGLTIFSVPYVAMGYEMTDDFHERTNIMAVAQWIGQWAWVIAPWFWYFIFKPELFSSPQEACRELAIWVAGIFTLIAIYPAVFVKSKSTLDRSDFKPVTFRSIRGRLSEIFTTAIELFKIKPFKKICVSTFLIFGTFNTVANLTFFVIVQYMFSGNEGEAGVWPILHGSIGALVTTFLVIPVVAYLSNKIGKKRTFITTQFVSIIGYVLFWFLFIPGKPYMFLFALPFFSFGIGGLFTIMMSMTSDICDLDELNSGERREGTLGAIYWWMVKVGFALAGLLAGLFMTLVGFDSSIQVQSPETVSDLRFFYSVFPIIGTLVAIYIMKDYSIDEARANEIRTALNKRKNEVSKTSSAYGSGNLTSLSNLELNLKSYTPTDVSKLTEKDLKATYKTTLNNQLHGLCFSPYVEGQNTGDILTESQINRRMDIISPYTKWVRSFSCTAGNELIPNNAHKNGLKTIVGAWISADKDKNEQEIQSLIELAKAGLVDIAAVGNEVLLRGDCSEEELIGYINSVKKALTGLNIPVGYVDTYYEFHKRPKIVEVSDVILSNCYPFWEGISIDDALINLRKMHAITKQAANGKPVIISETGWPSKGEAVLDAAPSEINAMRYFINTQNWAQTEGVAIFHFSSFDESWKVAIEGEVGARWGIWDKDETLKYEK